MIIRVLDLETLGLEPPAGVCEIAFTNLVSTEDGGWEVESGISEWLIYPGQPIPPETSAVHHIVDEDVVGAPSFEDVTARIFAPEANPPDATVLAAHVAKFERQWLTDEVTHGLPFICTYKAAMRLYPEAPSHSNQALRYWLRPQGLNRAIASVAHRAGPDSYVTAFLLRDMLARASVADLIAWSSQPVLQRTCQFGKWRGKPWSEVDTGYLEWAADKDFDEDVLFTVRHELQRRFHQPEKKELF